MDSVSLCGHNWLLFPVEDQVEHSQYLMDFFILLWTKFVYGNVKFWLVKIVLYIVLHKFVHI